MTLTLASPARISADPRVLDDIRDKDCNLAVWTREPLAGVAETLPAQFKDIRLDSAPDKVGAAMRFALRDAGFAPGDDCDALAEDICRLAEHYCAILRIEQLELRLELVTTDACRKFHADYVTARLITTYCGQGTQWVVPEDAERIASGEEPREIRSLGTGDVGLFKGKLATTQPAVHRSPPIGGMGEKRLLLVLNPCDDA